MKKESIIIALLGVLIGAGLVLTYQKITEHRHKLVAEYRDWRKVNLILQSLDENYVDSIDRKKVTDAVANAALAALDPHSIYLPPQELKDSEEDLAGNFDGIGIQFNVPNDTAVVIELSVEDAEDRNSEKRDHVQGKVVYVKAEELPCCHNQESERTGDDTQLLLDLVALSQRNAVELRESCDHYDEEQGAECRPVPYESEYHDQHEHYTRDGPHCKVIHLPKVFPEVSLLLPEVPPTVFRQAPALKRSAHCPRDAPRRAFRPSGRR